MQTFVATYSRPSLTWEDLPFLRERTKLPILLKGILHPDDARRAVDEGMDGIIVSNHGGRQVDGATPRSTRCRGSPRRSTAACRWCWTAASAAARTSFKALALGATAVRIGRPYVYALAIAGEAGVLRCSSNFKADFDLTLGLSGCRSVDEIGPECLSTRP